MRLLSIVLAAWGLTGCVDVFRGAIVYLNLKSIPVSAEGEHYELFAEVNDGAVSLGQFKVLRAIEDCGQDPDLVAPLTLVQRYDNGVEGSEICSFSRRLGARDEINLAAGLLVGGVRIDSPVDLREARRVFVTVEPDGDGDPRPSVAVMGADLARGRSPQAAAEIACLEAFCASDPENPACETIPALPRERRGVILGTLLQSPVTDPCNPTVTGDVAIVPAEDETF
ncbi:MAG: hypothetical protein R3F60_07430 [bacterium]